MTYKRKQVNDWDQQQPLKEFVWSVVESSSKGYSSLFTNQLPHILKMMGQRPEWGVAETIYNFMNDGVVRNTCLCCGEPTKFKHIHHGYNEYCSMSCRAKHKQSYLNGVTESALSKRAAWRNSLSDVERMALVESSTNTRQERYGTRGNPHAKSVGRDRKIRRYGIEVVNKLESAKFFDDVISSGRSCVEVAVDLGVSVDVVLGHAKKLNKSFANNPMGAGVSKEEMGLYEYVLSLGVDVIPHHIIQGQKEVDLFVPSMNVAFEYNGSYWHSPDNPLSKINPKSHLDKTLLCQSLGIKLIHIFDSDWLGKQSVVKSRIKSALKCTSTIYARKCTVLELDKPVADQFFDRSHLQGKGRSRVAYGLYYDGQLVSAMSFGTPRYSKTADWEIIRSASIDGFTVVGGASKLFAAFVRDHNPQLVVTYADRCWGEGNVYTQLGMVKAGTTPCSYWLVNPRDPFKKRSHRSTYMKHKLVALGHDPNMTEHEITKSMGLYRVYDCGTVRYEYTPTMEL